MSLHVFDFDGTLLRSPEDPAYGWDWWDMAESMEPPCLPWEPDASWWIASTLAAARKAIQDPTAYTMLLTGRLDKIFRYRIEDLLVQQDLDFDVVALRPSTESKRWKLATILNAAMLHDANVIHLHDDRVDHLDFYAAQLEAQGYAVVSNLVAEPTPQCCYEDTGTTGHRDPGDQRTSGQPGGTVDGTRTSSARNKRNPRSPDGRHRGPMANSAKNQIRNRRAAFLRLAQDPAVGPTEPEMVEKLEDDPGANWRELYLQPIIRTIRNRFDLEKGQVSLVGPSKRVPYGSDTLGFDITGHVRFKDFVPSQEEFGKQPYRFTATITPDGEVMEPINIEGT